jgi:signal transduction histidine kinase
MGIASHTVNVRMDFLFKSGAPVTAWSRRRLLVDGLIAAVVVACQVGGTYALAAHRGWSVTDAGFALQVASGAALVFRRRFPVAVLAVTYALTFSYLLVERHGGAVWLSVIVAFTTTIVRGMRIPATVFLVLGYVGFLWAPLAAGKRHLPSPGFAITLGVALAFLLGAAELIRLRGQRAIAQAARVEQEALRTAGEERIRIARELHDVVAHNISVINVQARTALHLLDAEPERARAALETITAISRQALVEFRSVLDVLRSVDEPAPRAPTPSLAALDGLLVPLRDSGLDVQLEMRGTTRPLSANVDLAAYRIVQEALTNAARHSGATSATVHVAFDEHELRLEVDDNGHGLSPGQANGGGHGIVGMRERANALGGSFVAGPRTGGGFTVQARLPYQEVGIA